MSIQYIVEVAVPGTRVEHRFDGYENAKRYAADVLALNPGVEVHLYQQEGEWRMEVRRDAWGRGVSE